MDSALPRFEVFQCLQSSDERTLVTESATEAGSRHRFGGRGLHHDTRPCGRRVLAAVRRHDHPRRARPDHDAGHPTARHPKPDISAVTGGTGRFDDAAGELLLEFPPDGSTLWHIQLKS